MAFMNFKFSGGKIAQLSRRTTPNFIRVGNYTYVDCATPNLRSATEPTTLIGSELIQHARAARKEDLGEHSGSTALTGMCAIAHLIRFRCRPECALRSILP